MGDKRNFNIVMSISLNSVGLWLNMFKVAPKAYEGIELLR